MATYQWDLKSNYMLAFTVCKYDSSTDRWTDIAKDLADHLATTPQSCQAQFDLLCQQYGQDWQQQSNESLQTYVFSIIKRLYYSDLCQRMNESRDLLMVMYDFIRLFKGGRITPHDINEILVDVRRSVPTSANGHEYDERQQKITMLERLKQHMAEKMHSNSETQVQYASFPMELLPPPPFFELPLSQPNHISQEPALPVVNNNDHQVPSSNGHYPADTNAAAVAVAAAAATFSSFSQSSSVLVNKDRFSAVINASNDISVDEIELSSGDDEDEDDDDDEDADEDDDRTATAAATTTGEGAHSTATDEPVRNFNSINDQDESTSSSEEQMETTESSMVPPILDEVSNSEDGDIYDNVSSTSLSNQSAFGTCLSSNGRITSSTNGPPASSSAQLNASISGSSDHVTLDSNPLSSTQNHYPTETESAVVTPSVIAIDDDEVARMDAEQIPESVPADLTDITVPNDNAVFAVEELVSNTAAPSTAAMSTEEPTMISDVTRCDIRASSETPDHHASFVTPRHSQNQSRSVDIASSSLNSSLSPNFRKSVITILNNLKNAKYGPDFTRPLKSFKLDDDYYIRVKKPLDIPEIRQRMQNGDYDTSLLLFERDVLLMLTNALCMYPRDHGVHGHAQEMLNYALELFTPLDEAHIPWNISNGHRAHDDLHPSGVLHSDNGNESDDSTLHHFVSTRTPSIASTSSSIRTDSSVKHSRSSTTPMHTMQKRQRKTMR